MSLVGLHINVYLAFLKDKMEMILEKNPKKPKKKKKTTIEPYI